jgi:hypothetical protein
VARPKLIKERLTGTRANVDDFLKRYSVNDMKILGKRLEDGKAEQVPNNQSYLNIRFERCKKQLIAQCKRTHVVAAHKFSKAICDVFLFGEGASH